MSLPVSLKVVQTYDEISALIDKSYNKPVFNDQYNQESFEKEFFEIYNAVRERLTIFAEEVSYKEKGIHWGPIGRDRSIGVVLDDKRIFRPELLVAIWDIVSKYQENYLVYIDGEYDLGVGSFYICIKKDEILGFAEEPERLRPFGFQ